MSIARLKDLVEKNLKMEKFILDSGKKIKGLDMEKSMTKEKSFYQKVSTEMIKLSNSFDN